MSQVGSKGPAPFFTPVHPPASPWANWRQWPTKLVHVWTQLLLLVPDLIATKGHLYPSLLFTLWPHKRQNRSQSRLVRRALGTKNYLNGVSGVWKPSITGHFVSQRCNFHFRTQSLCLWPCPRSKKQDTIWGGMSFLPGWSRANNPIIVFREGESGTFSGALPRTTSQFEPQRNPNWEKHSHWGNRTSFVVPLRWSQPSFHKVMLQIPSAFLHFLIIVSLGKIPTSQHPGISFLKIQVQSPFKWFFKKILVIFKNYYTVVTNFKISCFVIGLS